MERRSFLVVCAAACAATSGVARANPSLRPRLYHRALLVDANDAPLPAASLVPQRNYIFHYPYTATPCFLLNLGKPTRPAVTLKTADARSYQWSGGIGPHQGIVAYSAICTHKLTYPTRQISFISYRPEPTLNSNLSQVIHCCSEHSQYDPAQGARVLAGPAPQPLAAILLEHDAGRDRLFALGTLGGEMFDEFFAKYAFRLSLERGGDHPRQEVGKTVKVTDLEDYCRQQVRC
jgi:arsenite oxidase small subunit